MVEIGPGEGALTRHLLKLVGHFEVIELDRDLASGLAAELPPPHLVVHCADALEYDFTRFPPGMRIVGNLPYNISTPLLFHLARFAQRVRDLHFMLQLEVVERMVAAPSTAAYGRLSVALQARFAMQKLFKVSRGAFRPPPKVESAVGGLVPPPAGRPNDDDPLGEALFGRPQQPRHTPPPGGFGPARLAPPPRPPKSPPRGPAAP